MEREECEKKLNKLGIKVPWDCLAKEE